MLTENKAEKENKKDNASRQCFECLYYTMCPIWRTLDSYQRQMSIEAIDVTDLAHICHKFIPIHSPDKYV